MEKIKSSNFGEKCDVGYHPCSPCVDHSPFSTLSGDSFAYCRAWTSSEASNSNLSETVDDSSYASDQPSPSRWTAVNKASGAKQAASHSKLGMKLRKHSVDINKLDGSDLLDSGWFATPCVIVTCEVFLLENKHNLQQ